MENFKLKITALAALLLLAVIWKSAFVMNEQEQVIITQFGKPVGQPITSPGIHFKIPFIQTAIFFDRRFLEWDGSPNQIPTKDKRFIWTDTYARWRISDALLFFQRVRDERGAQSRLDDILDGETRNAIANHLLVELIRSSNRQYTLDEELTEDESSGTLQKVEMGRAAITKAIIAAAAPRTQELGIELMDLRFKRINYVKEVQQKIFERMISERRQIADKYRSEGQGKASKILGEKERELKGIQSQAYREAQEIKGKGDAEATAIYAAAYDQSPDSREFYRFLKTMETYKTTMTDKDMLFLSTDGDFMGYMNSFKAK